MLSSVVTVLLTSASLLQAAQVLRGTEFVLLHVQGDVDVAAPGVDDWSPATAGVLLGVGHRLRTGPESRAALRSAATATVVQVGAETSVEFQPKPADRPGLVWRFLRGFGYFFNRDRALDEVIDSDYAAAGPRSTEFHVRVGPEGLAVFVFDGEVDVSNARGRTALGSGETAVVEPGAAPRPGGRVEAVHVIQWCLRYPAVLRLEDLDWPDDAAVVLATSWSAYRLGDPLTALSQYPRGRVSESEAERVYRAGLALGVGDVEAAERWLAAVSARSEAAEAIRHTVAAVKFLGRAGSKPSETATGWMAQSYVLQSLAGMRTAELAKALDAARQATVLAPDWGAAWVRLAELEFSHGNLAAARASLDRGMALAPLHPVGWALTGFIAAGQGRIEEAISAFDHAITRDGALADAWLGRGLCRTRKGDREGGRTDLLVAAALEPQRSVLRSYLGKAFADAGQAESARREFHLARALDAGDPTSYLYSALQQHAENRVNDAIRDLERSRALNDRRGLYRSALLLDQDRAVRSANLARLYQDAGMTEQGLREAGRAMAADYANYSAHLFLANAYDVLRDPGRVDLRYETPAVAEYTIANLLAPAGAGALSSAVSQGEYSRLFESDHLALASTTTYTSRGDWAETGAQYGTMDTVSYALEGIYASQRGYAPNQDFVERQMGVQFRQQISSADAVFVRLSDYHAEGGDIRSRYDPSQAAAGYRTREDQDPGLLVGYHRQWTPGAHTLVIAGRTKADYQVTDPHHPSLFVLQEPGIPPAFVEPVETTLDYGSEIAVTTLEAQQLWQTAARHAVVGVRYQNGSIEASNAMQYGAVLGDSAPYFPNDGVAAATEVGGDLERFSAYAYLQFTVLPRLQGVAGVTYDSLRYPRNFRAPPITPGEETRDLVSPKAGLLWNPLPCTWLQAAGFQSLSGASLDQSVRIEPTHVAGFPQAFRGYIPESVAGASAGAEIEGVGVLWEQKLGAGTYVGVSAQWGWSEADRAIGVFQYVPPSWTDPDPYWFERPAAMTESLDYRERLVQVTLDQLLGAHWALGLRYRWTDVDLDEVFGSIPEDPAVTRINGAFRPRQSLGSTWQQALAQVIYNHPGGWFAQAQIRWNRQSNHGYAPALGSDEFWQADVVGGCRFWKRRAEVALGLLNVADTDYSYNPLAGGGGWPRERLLVVRLRLSF
ncbi:MAG TPA: hypothetical protein PKM73_08925 [Verrucomicrobiota bacterium]|nr:hypothetical protein [Verrucomicrobiota bacterium]HNU51871.1 hypothetical protein [Verrucomicrobiota bacterium]